MPRVVIAEDHEVVRDGLRRVLEANGIAVIGEVGDGLEVVAIIERMKPDVLVLDLSLPGLHGSDVLRAVKRRALRTRVLVLSAEKREDVVVDALRAGAAGYLLKTCSVRELVEAVLAVAAGRHPVSSEVSDAFMRGLDRGAFAGPDDPYDRLTSREREVFHLMAEGLSNAAIGARLFISSRTAETHRAHVLRRLGLRNQTEVVRFALRRGLLTLDG